MADLNEFLEDVLMHYTDQVYDPVKAHQYYEEHKQLQGRSKSGNSDAPSNRSQPSKVAPKKSASQRQAEIAAEVAALKARLEQLRLLLRELVKQAKLRSGIEPTQTKSETKADKPPTTAEKAEAAKKAHDYYEKTKETLPSRQEAEVLKRKIKAAEKKIAEMKAKIQAALNTTQIQQPSPSEPDIHKSKEGDRQNGT